MTVDPTEPDTFEELAEDEPLDPEAPEADAAEQHTDLRQRRDEEAKDFDPASANDADVAEQSRVVDLDEDDYR
ncbi:hypothetical protein [Streptomyces indicus]|uniref:Uncharacterized protein n=1 Tax=Streptomyces indicus TaxID=417292 RepID=A0A1G9FVN5_9ACTN|nr:hypothetical protein [Streptomyces indicus]SDK92418.1 hypothetical protein SAMN05421806_11489 [Streptomyces indicus]